MEDGGCVLTHQRLKETCGGDDCLACRSVAAGKSCLYCILFIGLQRRYLREGVEVLVCSLEARKISLVLAKCNKTKCWFLVINYNKRFLTSSFADVSSLVLADVVVPVAVVNIYRQAVFTVKIIWVTCEETRDIQFQLLCLSLRRNLLVSFIHVFFPSGRKNCSIFKASLKYFNTFLKKSCP